MNDDNVRFIDCYSTLVRTESNLKFLIPRMSQNDRKEVEVVIENLNESMAILLETSIIKGMRTIEETVKAKK